VSSKFFENPSVHPREDLYMYFSGISFMHPYTQSGRWQDVLDTACISLPEGEHLVVRNISKTLRLN